MPIYTYPGSETSEYKESFDKIEDTKTTEEQPQESQMVTIGSAKNQIIGGYQEVDEFYHSDDGYISKMYDSDTWIKRRLEQGATIIMVNRAVWMGLPEHERILWGRLGDIEKVNSISKTH